MSSTSTMERQDSVELEEAVTKALKEATSISHRLFDLWRQMGVSDHVLGNRVDAYLSVFRQMEAEEEQHVRKLTDAIEDGLAERQRLTKELGVSVEDPDAQATLLSVDKFLRGQIRQLKEKKAERMREMLEIRDEDHTLAAKLDVEPFAISAKHIASQDQIQSLKDHLAGLKKLEKERSAQFQERKLAIIDLISKLGQEPANSFELNIVCEPDEAIQLTEKNLARVLDVLRRLDSEADERRRRVKAMRDRITSLQEKLQLDSSTFDTPSDVDDVPSTNTMKQMEEKLSELEELKLTKLETVTHHTRVQIQEFWDLCFFSNRQRQEFLGFTSDNFTETLLDEHDEKLEELKSYYDTHSLLLDKVHRFKQLWRKRVLLEEKQHDPERLFKAKGNALLKEEKERKEVQRLLPKLEADLLKEATVFRQQFKKDFLVDDMALDQMIDHMNEEHARSQQEERSRKQNVKKQQNEHELVYGSKPATAVNRTMINLKRKGPVTPSLSDRKRTKMLQQPASAQLAGSVIRSPLRPTSANTITTRQSRVRRGHDLLQPDRHNDTIVRGFQHQSNNAAHLTSMNSEGSDQFRTDLHKQAFTSTFSDTPETGPQCRVTTPLTDRAANRDTFKTPYATRSRGLATPKSVDSGTMKKQRATRGARRFIIM